MNSTSSTSLRGLAKGNGYLGQDRHPRVEPFGWFRAGKVTLVSGSWPSQTARWVTPMYSADRVADVDHSERSGG